MAQVSLYTTRFCPFCIRAKMLLDAKKIEYSEIPVDVDQAERPGWVAHSTSDLDRGKTYRGL